MKQIIDGLVQFFFFEFLKKIEIINMLINLHYKSILDFIDNMGKIKKIEEKAS